MQGSLGKCDGMIDKVDDHFDRGFIDFLHRVPNKTCDYILYNIFNNNCPITIVFGTVSSKSMCHRKVVSFPTSPI